VTTLRGLETAVIALVLAVLFLLLGEVYLFFLLVGRSVVNN